MAMKLHWTLASLAFLAGSQSARADYSAWLHSGTLPILTTPEGADLPISTAIEQFPLLVRLHSDYFDFSQAHPSGDDIRFSSANGEPLAYQIEEWNPARGVACIWVRIPKIQGNSRQEIKLHWGNPRAKAESNGKAVFNESNGYLSVWHMDQPVQDAVATLTSLDTGATSTAGVIGPARHFPGQKGVFGGERIPNYPSGAASHSTELWVRAEKPNTTLIGWGNEGGGRGSKVRMQLRSPPHIHIDSDFSDVDGKVAVPLREWVHIVHTYDREDGKIYINGKLDASARPLLNIKSPARLWLGGWYHNYDFVGDIDEVRISKVARSANWIRLQYQNQKPLQTLVGPLVQAGNTFAVSHTKVVLAEDKRLTLTGTAGGAQQVYWIIKRDGRESLVSSNRFSYTLDAGRVIGDQSFVLQFKAIYPNEVKTLDIPVTITEDVPEPIFTLQSPATWDGRKTIEVVPIVSNLEAMRARGVANLNYHWTVSDIAAIKEIGPDRLVLKRALNSGSLTVSVALENGGSAIVRKANIIVAEPVSDLWKPRQASAEEKPVDNQFYPRNDRNEGTLYYAGKLSQMAESVYLKLYANDELVSTLSQKLAEDRAYSLSTILKPGLIKYRTEFGMKKGEAETLLHSAKNLICGDAFIVDGQSNAEATDVGKDDPTFTSEWIRSFGSMSGDPRGARDDHWYAAVVRDRNGGKGQIGYWGMELARNLVDRHRIPVCIINGAVGGSRIDQHQRNGMNPTDVATIYGRLLWRVQAAGLTHGIRAALWHQGENDQGADGPTGGYGWETYARDFMDMAAGWKQDYPNLQRYYVFQIWPKACSMGVNGSDNRLREVQRTLPRFVAHLDVMSTLGISPPGGCHFPREGYAEFARLIGPLLERDFHRLMPRTSITAPDLKRVSFGKENEELMLEFDQPVRWNNALASQFYLDGAKGKVSSGSVSGNTLRLKLAEPSQAKTLSYLDSASWSQDRLLRGENGIAALTFCEVPVLAHR